MQAYLESLGVLRPHWPEAMDEIHWLREVVQLRQRQSFCLPYFPRMRLRGLTGDVAWDRTVPELLREEYVRRMLYDGLTLTVPVEDRVWRTWRVYLDCNLSVRRAEVFIHLILGRVETPDYQLFDSRWHVSLCRVVEGIEPAALHELMEDLEREHLRAVQFDFLLTPVDWTHPPRYVHFGLEGSLLDVALLLRRELRVRLAAHLSPATRGAPGRLHLAVPVSGPNVPDTAV